MVTIVFRSRLRPDAGEAYPAVAAEMLELARTMPGFRSFKMFVADDGERVSVIEFESMADVDRWREHPEHRKAQAMGREQFYSEYRIQVCEPIRDYGFSRGGDTAE